MRVLVPATVLLLLPLAGCGSLLSETTADVAGIGGAAISGSITKNAAVATGIGLGVQGAANAGLLYTERVVHHAEQQAIADAAGPLPVGAVAPWQVVHDIPIEEDRHGRVTVSRAFGQPGFACKEIVFSVEGGRDAKVKEQGFYTATVCNNGRKWEWASAEPATARWGALQ